jgi:hypothetical protein
MSLTAALFVFVTKQKVLMGLYVCIEGFRLLRTEKTNSANLVHLITCYFHVCRFIRYC